MSPFNAMWEQNVIRIGGWPMQQHQVAAVFFLVFFCWMRRTTARRRRQSWSITYGPVKAFADTPRPFRQFVEHCPLVTNFEFLINHQSCARVREDKV